jgi:deoxycytidylate deaminase
MFLASSSAARSAQLGRQVGAAIATPEGDVVAVGMNEVPSPRGGLYWEGDKEDARDHTRSIDSNAEQRDLIIQSIVDKLTNEILDFAEFEILIKGILEDFQIENIPSEFPEILNKRLAQHPRLLNQRLTSKAIASSDLRLITEYGRAVHGEMDAILTCARLGIPVRGKHLFVTTFPCHNCTRHIIASGINKVYYIEPYPKSKAKELHSDAICFDEETATKTSKIPFLPFVGVGPRRYLDLFSLDLSSGRPIERKDDENRPLNLSKPMRPPRVPMVPLSFLDREEKLQADFKSKVDELLGHPRLSEGGDQSR